MATATTGNGKSARTLRGKDKNNVPAMPDPASVGLPEEEKLTQEDIPRILTISAIRFEYALVQIRGLNALLCNKAREASLLQIEDNQTGKAKQKKPPRIPEQEFIESCHICEGRYETTWLDKNLYGFPVVGIKKAMANAGYRFGDAKNKVEQMGSFFLHGEYDGLTPILATAPEMMTCTLKDKNRFGDDVESAVPTMRRDFVVIPTGKTGNIAYRPQFWPWSMSLVIRYIPNFISLETVINYLNLAGRCIGIGSWRIESGGEKGEFEIANVSLLGSNYKPEIKAKVIDPGRIAKNEDQA